MGGSLRQRASPSFDHRGWGFVEQAFTRVLLLEGDAGQEPADVLGTLAPRFTWAPAGRRRVIRRTWLDTFDWRLYRAGMMLEQVSGGRPAGLSLTGPGGTLATAPAAGARWPALASALPEGPLRARLGPLTGVRALAPVVRAASTIRTYRVLNADGKTVARVSVDALTVRYPCPAEVPPRLTVTALRGYQGQAQQVAAGLARAPGATRARLSPLEDALAAAGSRPGAYSSRIGIRLDGQVPARQAVGAVLLRLLDTLEANVPGTLRDADTEFLHDLRVSVRRTRTALKVAGDVLPAALPAGFSGDFKWLGDLTTPTRDLDVYLLNYPVVAAGLVAAEPADLRPFHDHLVRSRAVQRRLLARGLRSARFRRLAAGWRDGLTGMPAQRDGPSAAEFAAARISRLYRRVLRQGRAIGPQSPPERLHSLRKRCKELRYLLEFFASLHEPAIHRQVVRELRGLQDCLGEFQDVQVQQQEIRDFAGQMMAEPGMPATALLAMGELAGHLGARQVQARSEFAERFAVFASPRNERLVGALTARGAG